MRFVTTVFLILATGCASSPPSTRPNIPKSLKDQAIGDLLGAISGYQSNMHHWPTSLAEIQQGASFKGISLDPKLYHSLRLEVRNQGMEILAQWIWPDGEAADLSITMLYHYFEDHPPPIPTQPSKDPIIATVEN